MKRILLSAAGLLIAALSLRAQSPTIYSKSPYIILSEYVTDVLPVPTSAATVTTNDAWLTGLTLIGGTSSTVHVTVTCLGSNRPVLNGTGIAATTLWAIPFPHVVWCRGGFSIVGDAAGAYYQAVFRQ